MTYSGVPDPVCPGRLGRIATGQALLAQLGVTVADQHRAERPAIPVSAAGGSVELRREEVVPAALPCPRRGFEAGCPVAGRERSSRPQRDVAHLMVDTVQAGQIDRRAETGQVVRAVRGPATALPQPRSFDR
jgi:hypothetical protein